MPTYDYLCTKCGHKFEEIQKMSDPSLTKCPECKGKLKRLIGTGIGIIFKGSGFYVTDSRSSSTAGGAGKKDASSTAESAKSEPAASTADKGSDKGYGKGSDGGSDKGSDKNPDKSATKTESKDSGSGASKS